MSASTTSSTATFSEGAGLSRSALFLLADGAIIIDGTRVLPAVPLFPADLANGAGLPTTKSPPKPASTASANERAYWSHMRKLDDLRATLNRLTIERSKHQARVSRMSTLRRVIAAKAKGEWTAPEDAKTAENLKKLARVVKGARPEKKLEKVGKSMRKLRVLEGRVVEQLRKDEDVLGAMAAKPTLYHWERPTGLERIGEL